MAQEAKARLVRVVDFVAESLETEANKMPPSLRAQADIIRQAAATMRESQNARMVRVWEQIPDYKIQPDGLEVVLMSDRATGRGTGPKPALGARLAFKTRHDTQQFVFAGESEGYVFEGKEFIVDTRAVGGA